MKTRFAPLATILALFFCFPQTSYATRRNAKHWKHAKQIYGLSNDISHGPVTYESRPLSAAAWNFTKQNSTISEIVYAWAGSKQAAKDVTAEVRAHFKNGVLDISSADASRIISSGSGNSFESSTLDRTKSTIGIFYKDIDGVHFRLFYSDSNVRLPELTQWDHSLDSRAAGGCFYANQLEEESRGLVTFTLANHPFSANHSAAFIYLRANFSNEHHYSDYAGAINSHESNKRKERRDLSNRGNWGQHDTYWRPHELALQLQPSIDPHYPLGAALRQHTDFEYTDEKGQRIKVVANDDISPGIANLNIPRDGDFWIAIDKNRFMMGSGKPTSINDINSGANNTSVMIDATHTFHPYLRHFALSNYFRARFEENRGDGRKDRKRDIFFAPMAYSNVKSYFLSPAKSFQTPAHMAGKFLYWRDQWKIDNDSRFSITFKAKGSAVGVGFGRMDETNQAQIAYRISAHQNEFKLRRGDSNDVLNVDMKSQRILPGTDPTQYYDYWVSLEGGLISFGHGTKPGENVVATYLDDKPLAATHYSFTCFDSPVDYTNIGGAQYSQTVQLEAGNFAYPVWHSHHRFSTADSGGIIFSAKNSGSITDKTLLVGLRDTLPTKDGSDTTPVYEVALGANNNTSSAISRMGARVRTQNGIDAMSGQPVGAVPANSQSYDYWVSYAQGTVAYGRGRTIGVNTIDSWRDLTPTTGIKYFAFSSGANTVEYNNIEITSVKSQNSYTATNQNSRYTDWMSGWQFSTENKGALTTVVATENNAQIGLATAGAPNAAMGNYDIVINDKGRAYIRKVGLKQDTSEVELANAQKPTAAGVPYWVLFNEGTIVLGTGTNVGAPASVVLNWTDADFIGSDTPIKRFSFSNSTGRTEYRNITALTLGQIQATLDAMEAALQSKEEQEAKWESDPTKQTITNMHANQFFWTNNEVWNAKRSFAARGKTSFSFKLKHMDANDLTVLIGLSSSLAPKDAANDYSGASYAIKIMSDGSLTLMKKGHAQPLAAVSFDSLKELEDSRKNHSIWLTYDNGAFALGINSSLGTNPVWRFTDDSPAADVAFCGVGVDQATVQYTEITTSPFHDPTRYTTTDDARYEWHADWKFAQPEKTSIAFTLQNPNPAKPLIGAIGLGSTVLPSGSLVNAPYGGALYSVIFDYTGKVFVRKQGQTSDKLGNYRPDRGSAELQRLLSLNDGTTHNCWLVYDGGGFMFGIDTEVGTQPVWQWVDEDLAFGAGHFSFTAFSSTMQLTNIKIADGADVQTLARSFSNLEMTLATPAPDGYSHTNVIVQALSNVISMRMFKDELPAFKEIVDTIVSNRELFVMDPVRNKHQRAMMADSLSDMLFEQLSPSDKSWLENVIAKLEGTVDLNERIQTYRAAFHKTVSTINPNEPDRILYMKKLSALGSMTPEQFQAQVDKNIEILTTLGGFVEEIVAYLKEPSDDSRKAFTQDERAILALLQLRAAAEQAIQHSQDPQYILDHLTDLPAVIGRVRTLQSLLEDRQQNRDNDPGGTLFTSAQITQLMTRFKELVDERHSLTQAGIQELKSLLRSAKITPGFTGDTHELVTLQNRLSELLALVDKPLEFAEILPKLINRVASIYTLTPESSDFANRQAFFANLAGLLDAPGVATTPELQSALDSIIAPLRERPTYAEHGEDMILNRVEQGIKQLLANNDTIKTAIMSSQDPSYIVNNLDQLGEYDTRITRVLSLFDMIRTESNMSLSTAQANIVMEQLTAMVFVRGQMTDDTIKRLRLALQTARVVPGIGGNNMLEEQITQLRATLNEPVPFKDLLDTALEKVGAVVLKQPSDQERKDFMALMTRMLASEDTKTNEQLTTILTQIIEAFEGVMLVNENDPSNDAGKIAQLRASAEMLLAGNKTFASQLQIARTTKQTLYEYAQALNRMLLEKDTQVTFTQQDLETFIQEILYIVGSRELLTTEQISGTTASGDGTQAQQDVSQFGIQTFIRTAQLNASFANFADLEDAFADISLPHDFRDRIEFMTKETAQLINRMPSAEDYFLKRLLNKIDLLPDAPGLRTNESFTQLEHNILIPLAGLSILSDADKTRIQTIRKTLLAAKEATLAEQRKFSHHFALAQEKKDDTTMYLNMLRSLILMQRQQEITEITKEDVVAYTALLQKLFNDRDALTQEQITILGEILNYNAGSRMYDAYSEQKAVVTQLYNAINDPNQVITLEERITKYAQELAANKDLPILPSDDKLVRMPFFDKLARLRDPNVPGQLTPALAEILREKIIPPLRNSKTDDREEEVLAGLDEMLAEHTTASGNVAYQLKYANDSHLLLVDYAKAVTDVIGQKNKTLTFDAADDERALTALQYIVDNRELLNSSSAKQGEQSQIQKVQQMLRTIIWMGQLSEYGAELQTMLATLGEPHQFEDRIVYAAQELKNMLTSNVNLESTQVKRFISKMQLILDAPGVKKNVILTPEEKERGNIPVDARGDFRTLETLIIEPLKMMDLSSDRMQEVLALEARIVKEKPGILTEQGKFSYHMEQAQEHIESTSRYINALKEIIANLRKSEVTATSTDINNFVRTLAVLVTDRQAMSKEDVEALRTTINFTYYSPSFASKRSELLAMYNMAGTSVPFSEQIEQLIAGLDTVLAPSATAKQRSNYFAKLARIQEVQNDPKATIRLSDTDRLKEQILNRVGHLPLTPEERANLTAAQNFVAQIEEYAKQLSFHMSILDKDIKAAQADNSVDHIEVMITGLREIITMRNANRITFAPHEYEHVMLLARELVYDRELFNAAQVSTVQGILRSLEFGAGFEKFADELAQLHDSAGTPWTFQERLTKYRDMFAGINGKPTDDPDKNEYTAMVATIFNAPGERTKADLEELLRMVLDPIKHGNFTAEQKALIAPVMTQFYTEMRTIKLLASRLERAMSEPTPAQYHAALTSILRDHQNDKAIDDNTELTSNEKEQQRIIIFEAADYDTVMAAFEKEVELRPIIGSEQSTLFTAIQQLKNTRTFKDRIDYSSRIEKMRENVITDADIAARAQYFVESITSVLEKDGLDGKRKQFFYRLLTFRNNLAQLPPERLVVNGVQEALKASGEALGQYVAAPGIMPTEAATVQQTKDQMMALSNQAEQVAQAAAVTTPSILPSISGIVPTTMVRSSAPSTAYRAPAAVLPTATVSRFSRR